MERPLQGEVGSGKTVVALYALLRAVEAGKKGALMAPTETLAEQHFLTLEEPCRELGLRSRCDAARSKDDPNAPAQHRSSERSSHPGGRRPEPSSQSQSSTSNIGSEWSSGAPSPAGRTPHVLHMTATPIPRTLALTVYGDLR